MYCGPVRTEKMIRNVEKILIWSQIKGQINLVKRGGVADPDPHGTGAPPKN